ncbi:N-terminal domain of galactosyltransferase [Flavobacteriaceae bacterium MAR_2010_188]|nr:N-terminal domain of galactosyltransferase [Flavobacteriaceae bacterium MAR_2010_188]
MSSIISVIVGFRNRDVLRVKRHVDSFENQIFRDFEVIFVDYGSDAEVAKEIESLVSGYSFCKYVYNYTIGFPWNRSHALNTGLRISIGEHILFSDIDLIYDPNFLMNLISRKKDNVQLFQQVYWLPEQFIDYQNINAKLNDFTISDSGSKGGVHFIEREKLFEIGGYDEFYCFWGHEDNDLFHRLDKSGIKTEWMAPDVAPVFHQWHPIATSETKNFMPDRWWDLTTIYMNLNRGQLIRNASGWGRIYSKNERPSLTSKDIVTYSVKIAKNTFEKAGEYKRIIESLNSLKSGQCLEVIAVNKKYDVRVTFVQKMGRKIANLIIKTLNLPYNLVERDYFKALKYNNLNTIDDILFLIWQLVISKELGDYAILETDHKLVVRLTRK